VRSHLETQWSKSNTLTVADHHPADDCQRASTHKHLLHDDDDDDDDDSEAGGTHVTSSTQNHPKPPGVQNRTGTSSGSTACCRSNRAGRKRCRCYVTSSQVRGQHSFHVSVYKQRSLTPDNVGSFLVHGQVTFIFVVSVGLSVCLFVCAQFFSAVFDPISIKLGHTLYVWV